jgi:hypothetical protein
MTSVVWRGRHRPREIGAIGTVAGIAQIDLSTRQLLSSPLDRSGDQRFGPRAGAAVKQIVRGFQVTSHEDSRHDRQHAFAPFVHKSNFSMFVFCSPYGFRAKEITPVVYTCGVSVLQELRRTKAVLGGL